MAETSKARARHLASGYFDRYFIGRGLDIGAGDDPVTGHCDIFEKPQPDNGTPPEGHTVFYGDAHELEGVERYAYDYVYASHILEHLEDPRKALRSWFECLKPGGILFVSVPHRDYYERKRLLPSAWNADHKGFWLPLEIDPPHTWSLDFVIAHAIGFQWYNHPEPIRYFVTESDRDLPLSEHATGEYSIECIIRKT